MKVNIAGKGTISLLGITAPIRNKDLTETEIKALLNVGSIKLYDSATGINIGPNNVDSFFHDVTVESAKEVSPVKEPEEVVTETKTEEPVEEASEEVTEPETETEEENDVEESVTEEPTEETVSEEVVTEETKAEDTSNVPNYSSHSKKNKKKK